MICRIRIDVCCLPTILLFSTYSSRRFRLFSFKIASIQPICISWLHSGAADDMASPHIFSSLVAHAASSNPGYNPVAASTVVSTAPTSATEMSPEEVARTSSAYAIIASLIQAVPSPTRAVASISTCSGCKRFRDDEPSPPAKQFRSSEELWRTRLEISPMFGLASPHVHGATCGWKESNTFAGLPPAMSTVSITSMEVSVYKSCFQYLLNGHRFLSMPLKGARPHVLIEYSCHDTTVRALVRWVSMWDRPNWQ